MAAINSKKSFVTYIVAAIVLVVLANVVSRNFFFRWDLTENKIYSLSPSSKGVIAKIDDLLTAKVYFSENLPGQYGNTQRYLQDILEEYAAYSGGNFRFEFYQPDDDEQLGLEAQKSGIQPVQLQVIENDKMEVKRVYMGMVLLSGDKREVLPVIQTTTGLEYEITTKIKKLVDSNRPVIGIAAISGQNPKIENLSNELREAYEVRQVVLGGGVAPEVSLLIVAGVEDSLSGPEMASLNGFVNRGGNLFVTQSRIKGDLQSQMGQPIDTNIFEILDRFGVAVANNLVMDQQSGTITVSQQRGFLRFNSQVQYPFFPVIQSFPNNDMVSGLEQLQLLFSSEITFDRADSNVTVEPILVTSDNSSSQSGYINLNPIQNKSFEGLNEPGKVVGVYATAKSDSLPGTVSQLVLLGNSSFLVDDGGGQIPENSIFVMNAVDVLVGDKDLVGLRSREITARPLLPVDDASKTTWKTLNILLPAFLVILLGFIQWRLEVARTRRLEELYG
ncbi:MAG: GldG family protein [bacterium]|jgi:gliding-associated putative ABC transporter substrate-binding component GldG|nr:GldG family protein [bacterium]